MVLADYRVFCLAVYVYVYVYVFGAAAVVTSSRRDWLKWPLKPCSWNIVRPVVERRDAGL